MNSHQSFSRARTALVLVGGLALAGIAGATVYDVDQVIGAGGVTGTITTDGTVGLLAASDIVGWNLDLTGNEGATYHLVSGDGSGVEVGNISDAFNPNAGNADLTADSQHIYFNYDGTDGGYFGFQTLPFYGGNNYWCNASQNNNFDCAQGKAVVPVLYSDPTSIYQAASGNQILASVAAVPEPTTTGLMLAGLAGLVFTARRTRDRNRGTTSA